MEYNEWTKSEALSTFTLYFITIGGNRFLKTAYWNIYIYNKKN